MSIVPLLPDFDHPGKHVVRPTKLAHVVLRAFDFQKQKDWYVKFFNAKIQHENPWMVFLTYDEEHHRIALLNEKSPGQMAPKNNTLIHIAFTFSTLPDLLMAYRQRLQHDIKPAWCVNHGPTISLYYVDPEGNKIETQYDNFASPEEANAYIQSPEFAENPVGVAIDPEDMIARLVAGESEASLIKRPNIGRAGMEVIPEAMK